MEHRIAMTYRALLRLTLVAHLLAAGSLFPETLYVDPASGNDTFPGTQSQPLRTVTRALELSSPGTSIHMAPGVYQSSTGEVFPLQVPAGVTLRGDDPLLTILHGSSAQDIIRLPNAPGPYDPIEIRGIQFDGGRIGVQAQALDFMSFIPLTMQDTLFRNLDTAISIAASDGELWSAISNPPSYHSLHIRPPRYSS
jgi:hypothetical protein